MIMTGRKVVASEAYQMGLINRICDPGEAIDTAVKLARDIIRNPLVPMLNDRKSLYDNLESKNIDEAIGMEMKYGEDSVSLQTIGSSEFSFNKNDHMIFTSDESQICSIACFIFFNNFLSYKAFYQKGPSIRSNGSEFSVFLGTPLYEV